MNGRALFVAVVMASGATGVAAQEPDTVRFRLRPIEVNVMRAPTVDTRTPAAVTSVGSSLIQDAQLTAGLDEALVGVPGLLVNNRYNFSLGSRIAIRGIGARAAFGVRGVRVLMDGIPLTMPDGQANLNNLDLGAAGRIEVVRGPVSSLYGNAAGGVISVHSEEPPLNGFGGEVRYSAATLGRNGLDNAGKVQVKVGGRGSGFDYLVSASRLGVDGAREYSEADQRLLNARVRVGQPNSRWTFLLNAADAPTAQNPGSLPRDSFNLRPHMAWPRNVETGAGESATQVQGGITYDRTIGRTHGSISIYGATRSLENPLPFGFIALDRVSGGARFGITTVRNLLDREIEITAGADVEAQADDRREFDNVNGRAGNEVRRDQTDRVASVGPFVQLRAPLSRRVELSAGLRYDRIAFRTDDDLLGDGRDDSGSRTLSAVSPRIAVMYGVGENTIAYATVSTAFQTPTTTELINAPPAAGQPCCPAGFNADLDPQHARNYEIGLKGSSGDRVRYEVSVYHMDVRNTLVPFQVPEAEGREFFRNSGRTRHRGIEVAGAVRATRRITVDAAYTYSRFTFIDDGLDDQDFDGNVVPGVPPHHAFLRLYVTPLDRVALAVENEYTSAYFADDANTDFSRTTAANVANVRLDLDLRLGQTRLQPFFAVANLFDRHYASSVVINAAGARYFEPAPGRNFLAGTRIRFGDWSGR